jgi:hypothetical protein
MLKFIKRNGRIIPIRDNRTPQESVKHEVKVKKEKVKETVQSHFGKIALAGVAHGILDAKYRKFRGHYMSIPMGGRLGIIKFKTFPKRAGIVATALSLGSSAFSLHDAYKYGKEKKSKLQGFTRYLNNELAFSAGAFGGSIATKRISKIFGLIKGKKTTFSGKTFDAEIVKKGSSSIKGLPYKG